MPPSIFQQIVLPYLAHQSVASPARFARLFSCSVARTRAAANADPSCSTPSPIAHGSSKPWDYIPPISPIPYGAGHDPPQRSPSGGSSSRSRIPPAGPRHSGSKSQGGSAGEVLAFLKTLEESNGKRQATLMMALEKIASIPDHLIRRDAAEETRLRREAEKDRLALKSGSKKGKTRTEDTPSLKAGDVSPTPTSSSAATSSPETSELPPISLQTASEAEEQSRALMENLKSQHFPLVIYSLLRTRLYRLAVYHLLQTPEYAVDQPLLDRVAAHMTLDGAGKLARRLKRGWDGTLMPGSSAEYEEWDDDAPLPHRTPFGSIRRPDNAWLLSRRAAARPITPNPTLAALTANYNSHLTRALLSAKKGSSSSSIQHSSNPLTPLNNMLTTSHPLQKPSGGMRQLRQLLKKIDRLEQHRDFRPDWVTANLVVKCWMSCLMAAGEGWKVGSAGGRGQVEAEINKKGELRGLFGFVRALFEKGLEDQAEWEKIMAEGAAASDHGPSATSVRPVRPALAPTPSGSPSTSPSTSRTPSSATPKLYPYPQALSYIRHVRPFINDIIRAFKQIEDRAAVGHVIEWQQRMRERMEGDNVILRGGVPGRKGSFGLKGKRSET